MSLNPTGPGNRQSLLRNLAQQAAAHPRIEAAVMGAIRSELPAVIEQLLRTMYAGDEVRLYVRKGPSSDEMAERDRRIVALAGGPARLSVAQIAACERITARRVQQVLRKAAAKSSPL
jgi:hypothetical protein